MRKNDLIKKLQEIEGNPEVVVWNGYVGDYQHISNDLIEDYLIKETLSGYIEACRLEQCVTRKDFDFNFTSAEIEELEDYYRKTCSYTCNEFVTDEDFKKGRYKKKRIVYINPKLRGIDTWDRLGAIRY